MKLLLLLLLSTCSYAEVPKRADAFKILKDMRDNCSCNDPAPTGICKANIMCALSEPANSRNQARAFPHAADQNTKPNPTPTK